MPARFARLALMFALAGCGESSYDVYIRGLKIAGDAERRECKLAFDRQEQAHLLSSDKVLACLQANEKALAEFKRAEEMGHQGRDIAITIEDTQARIERLKTMLKFVQRTEFDQQQAALE